LKKKRTNKKTKSSENEKLSGDWGYVELLTGESIEKVMSEYSLDALIKLRAKIFFLQDVL